MKRIISVLSIILICSVSFSFFAYAKNLDAKNEGSLSSVASGFEVTDEMPFDNSEKATTKKSTTKATTKATTKKNNKTTSAKTTSKSKTTTVSTSSGSATTINNSTTQASTAASTTETPTVVPEGETTENSGEPIETIGATEEAKKDNRLGIILACAAGVVLIAIIILTVIRKKRFN
jgi:cobalamin biosynthesis Mg chelatase CobN